MTTYYRPLAQFDAVRPEGAVHLAGGWCWFDRVEVLERGRAAEVIAAAEVPGDVLARLTADRAPMAGLSFDAPRLMGILNVTPDSFSDGGQFAALGAALDHARDMAAQGIDLIDVGGESTRPGAVEVAVAEETARTAPVIAAIREAGITTPISIDTRKAPVAVAAAEAGAGIVNDVSAGLFDPAMLGEVARLGLPLCLMHAQGGPEVMQDDPRYADVLLDVYDHLATRIAAAEAAGIARARIMVDPGIGFGKTLAHNLALLRGLSLFHGLGCPILLGVSRKRFIGTISGAAEAGERMPGSVSVMQYGLGQGVQVVRVHDTLASKQAVALWQALVQGWEQD